MSLFGWGRRHAANVIHEEEAEGSAESETEAYDDSMLGAVGGSAVQPPSRLSVSMGHPRKRAQAQNAERDNRIARRTLLKAKSDQAKELKRQAAEAKRTEKAVRQKDMLMQQMMERQDRTIADIIRQNDEMKYQNVEAMRQRDEELSRVRVEMDRTRRLLEQAYEASTSRQPPDDLTRRDSLPPQVQPGPPIQQAADADHRGAEEAFTTSTPAAGLAAAGRGRGGRRQDGQEWLFPAPNDTNQPRAPEPVQARPPDVPQPPAPQPDPCQFCSAVMHCHIASTGQTTADRKKRKKRKI